MQLGDYDSNQKEQKQRQQEMYKNSLDVKLIL